MDYDSAVGCKVCCYYDVAGLVSVGGDGVVGDDFVCFGVGDDLYCWGAVVYDGCGGYG